MAPVLGLHPDHWQLCTATEPLDHPDLQPQEELGQLGALRPASPSARDVLHTQPSPSLPYHVSGAPAVLWLLPHTQASPKTPLIQSLPCGKHHVALAHASTSIPGDQAREVGHTAFHTQDLRTRERHCHYPTHIPHCAS